MKKFLMLFLVLAFSVVPFAVSADNDFFYANEGYGINGSITGICTIEKIAENGSEFNVVIDTNSTITFNTHIDTLSVSDNSVKNGDTYYLFDDGEKISDGTCTVNYTEGYRNDSQNNSSPDVDIENEVTYIKENATVRFNKPGSYFLHAVIGVEDGYDRLSHFERVEYGEYVYYNAPVLYFNITVKEPSASEDIYGVSYFDESVISISGITNYDESRVIQGDNVVAICSSPVVIETKTYLDSMGIVKLEKINGEWVEARYFDGFAINYGDTSKNWIPANGFENVDVDYYEFTGTEADLSGEALGINEGKKLSISEPGIYMVWANAANGDFTGLTFEIGDNYATYTDSRVLVNGKEIKFEAYNINDNNYFKLRDIAYVLTDSELGGVRFNVKWDGERNMINLLSSQEYEAVGGELKNGDGKDKNYKMSSSVLIKDGKNVTLTAYNINDNNYFKLRDLGKLFDFNVSWDGANNCILIDSLSSYIEP